MNSLKTSKPFQAYLMSITLVALTTFLGEWVKEKLEPTNLVMLYLLMVVIVATLWGRGPAILTSILSVLAFDFFLIPPYLTFVVHDIQYVFTFAGLLIVALVIGTLTSRIREQAIQAKEQEAQTSALYRLSKDLAAAESFEKALQAIRENVGKMLNGLMCIYFPVHHVLEPVSYDPDFPINEHEKTIATWVFENGKAAGPSADTLVAAQAHYRPLQTSQKTLGVLGIRLKEDRSQMTLEEQNLLSALGSQAAIAIQRSKFAEETRQIAVMKQTEKLQTALLNSISHDLRTPLVSITGTLSSLLQDTSLLKDQNRKELLEDAYEESTHLNRLVGNLLDMTRVESGTLKIQLKPCELRDVLGSALQSLREKLEKREIQIYIPNDFPEIPVDFSLMMRVFINLIDNAVKYSQADSLIKITAKILQNKVVIEVSDEGFGIPKEDLERIFDKFYRAVKTKSVIGTGLGLSICKGIIEAHGGKIWAQNNLNKGATFCVELPILIG